MMAQELLTLLGDVNRLLDLVETQLDSDADVIDALRTAHTRDAAHIEVYRLRIAGLERRLAAS